MEQTEYLACELDAAGFEPHAAELRRLAQDVDAQTKMLGRMSALQMDIDLKMAEAVAAAVAAERERWQEVVFDGWRVLQGLDEHARKRTSHQNVSDTLDALVRVMKPNAEAERQP